eukprot:365832-Chlamydomonas_euryale.AAC.12
MPCNRYVFVPSNKPEQRFWSHTNRSCTTDARNRAAAWQVMVAQGTEMRGACGVNGTCPTSCQTECRRRRCRSCRGSKLPTAAQPSNIEPPPAYHHLPGVENGEGRCATAASSSPVSGSTRLSPSGCTWRPIVCMACAGDPAALIAARWAR